MPLAGDGSRLRDWLHVEDYCAAAFTALLDGEPGTIHHVGSGHELCDIDLVHRILEHLGKSRDVVQFVSTPAGSPFVATGASKGAEGENRHSPAENPLPWKPRHAFDQGLRETIDWYVRNREWWEALAYS